MRPVAVYHLIKTEKDLLFRKTVRLKQSAYLLVNSNVNISEAAYMVGFSSPSYFSNTFNSFFGMTPKEFVMNYMDNSNEEEFRKRI